MCAFKVNEELELCWDRWADELLENGKPIWYCCMYDHGYNWCFRFENGTRRYCKNAPEHIQRRLGVVEDYIVRDAELPLTCYWGKKAHAPIGYANERDAS